MFSVGGLVVLAAVTVWLWHMLRGYVTRSPLDRVPGPPSSSFWRGNIPAMFNPLGWDFHDNNSQRYSQVFKFHGPLGARGLYVYDPKALHQVVVKNQDIFEETQWFITWNILMFGPGLLSTFGEQHRKQRRILNPVFSINHIRRLTPVFYSVVHRLRNAMVRQIEDGASEVDVLSWMGRVGLELIGQAGLGYSFDPLLEVRQDPLGNAVKGLIPYTYALHFWRVLSPYWTKIGTPGFRRAVAKFLPTRTMRTMTEIVATLKTKSTDIYKQKKAALEKGDDAMIHEVGEGKDVISVLMKANANSSIEDRLTDEEVIAQMATFVFAGMDTTSNALARILQVLAQHPEAQARLRAELRQEHETDAIPYDELGSLPYLDAVCRETLRLYPPVPFLSKEAREDVTLSLSHPIQGADGTTMTEIYIPKGTVIGVGIRSCNRSKTIWGDDALEWKPERWLSPLPASVTEHRVPGVYSNLMTFLGGGRACIGFKFSQLEMKVVLAELLRSFEFSLSNKEIVWNLGGVSYPTVGPTSKQPSLPMVVKIAKP